LKTTRRVVYSMTTKIRSKREACKVGKPLSLQYNYQILRTQRRIKWRHWWYCRRSI